MNQNLCNLARKGTCEPRKPDAWLPTYQRQIATPARNLDQLKRQFVSRKCCEDQIDERKALQEISKHRVCDPTMTELQLLQKLIKDEASPDTIIYQTYIVEADRGKYPGADETFRSLVTESSAVPAKRVVPALLRPCCEEDEPAGLHGTYSKRICMTKGDTPRPGSRIPRRRPTCGTPDLVEEPDPLTSSPPSNVCSPPTPATVRPKRRESPDATLRPCSPQTPGTVRHQKRRSFGSTPRPCSPQTPMTIRPQMRGSLDATLRPCSPQTPSTITSQRIESFPPSRSPFPRRTPNTICPQSQGSISFTPRPSPPRTPRDSPGSTPYPCPRQVSRAIPPLGGTSYSCPDDARPPDHPLQSPGSNQLGGYGTSTPLRPQRQIPVYFRNAGISPMTKRKTKIPVPVPATLVRAQRRQTRDITGSRIPFPVASRESLGRRFTRGRGPKRDRFPQSRRRISFGDVSYFEDALPSLVGVPSPDDTLGVVPLEQTATVIRPSTEVLEECKALIDQEKKEIRAMQNVVTQLMERPEKVEFRDMYTLLPNIPYLEETLTETAPEVAAAMLHSDELGLNMKSPPNEVYNTLFKGGEKDKTLVTVAPELDTKIVVPVSSEGFEASLIGYEARAPFESVGQEVQQFELPELPQPREIKGSTPEEEIHTEYEDTELKRLSSTFSEDQDVSQFEVNLHPDPQCGHDFIQIRGSQPPPWFPGYYVAMGDSPKINVVSKPWEVFEKAWRKLSPTNVKPEGGIYVLGI